MKATAEDYFNNIKEDKIKDMKNPNCIDCAECCTMTASITKKEYKEIKFYLKKNKKAVLQVNKVIDNMNQTIKDGKIDLYCPFSEKETKRCIIYDVRPQVCRSFHCSSTIKNNSKKIRSKGTLIIGDIFGFSFTSILNLLNK